ARGRRELAGPGEAPPRPPPGFWRFDGLPRALRAGPPRPAPLAHRAELVDAAEGGLVAAGDEARPDAPHVDARALLLEARDHVLVELVARDDPHFGEPALLQDSAPPHPEVPQLARLQPH